MIVILVDTQIGSNKVTIPINVTHDKKMFALSIEHHINRTLSSEELRLCERGYIIIDYRTYSYYEGVDRI